MEQKSEKSTPTLRDFRVTAGLSQEALARQVGVSLQTIGTWERGVNIPSLDKAVKLAEILQVSLKSAAASVGIDVSKIPDDCPPRMERLVPSSEEGGQIFIEDLSKVLNANTMADVAKNLNISLKTLFHAFGIDIAGIPDDHPQLTKQPSDRPQLEQPVPPEAKAET